MADLIAAGEVVERPASVVKELMENAIDAGADQITVEIKRGGITYIRITDNGCGIAREDIRNAFKSHATSKIVTEEDLHKIGTLGFR
ncbi:MAG TPA: ATP-binding protein, partial [Clostridiales bacterium]|nr:ATP-binding protein [Clostridiales bacterium]